MGIMQAGLANTNYIELDQNRVYWRVFVLTAMEFETYKFNQSRNIWKRSGDLHISSGKGISSTAELDNQFGLNRQVILIPMLLPDRALLQQNLCRCIMTELFIYIISEQISSLDFHFQ